ncbi:MAG: ribonuclease [Proteobacteria bacterium]|nr:ribonuclease [Pseudomonadota bacterium]
MALRVWLMWFMLCVSAGAQAHGHHAHHAQQSAQIATISAAELPAEANDTLRAIKQGGPFAYPRDGVVFGNYEHKLPELSRGCTSDTLLTKSADCGRKCEAGVPAPKDSVPPCRARYHEYTVKTPGVHNRGTRRIIAGSPAEYYYSADHYQTFKRIRE